MVFAAAAHGATRSAATDTNLEDFVAAGLSLADY